MPEKFDFKKELERAKGQLIKLSQEAAKVAKRGESELMKFSKMSKMHIDSTAASLKKEKLIYSLGKKYRCYLKSSKVKSPNEEIKKIYDEILKIEKEEKALKTKLKRKKK